MSFANTDIVDQVPNNFWDVIAAASQDPDAFRSLIGRMDRQQVIDFLWTYEELAAHLRTDKHARHAAPTLSEDGLAELANWVVGQGRDTYAEILRQPDRIPPRADDLGFVSELVEEFESRFSEDVPFNSNSWDPRWRERGKSGPWS